MKSLLKTTAASAALVVTLLASPISLVAHEATVDDADVLGTTSDPAANDETLAADETAADPAATGELGTNDTLTAEDGAASDGATAEDTQAEVGAEEETQEAEGPATVTVEDETDEDEDVDSTETGEETDTGDRLAAAIASAEGAAADIEIAAARLPAIVERIDALVTKVEGLPIENLVTELTLLAGSANTLVSSEATQALPADLSGALSEVEALLREIREGGVVDNTSATLQSARAAADALPGLAERAGVLLDQAGVTLEGFQGSGGLIRDVERAIREVADAADAVASLARAIERDPNSLIFGD